MADSLLVHLFAEDMAHESLLSNLIHRLAHEAHLTPTLHVLSARGGHGRALAELKVYQEAFLKMPQQKLPDVLVVGIDANCQSYARMKSSIERLLVSPFRDIAVIACPDPHIERWYLSDGRAFHRAVGLTPRYHRRKCVRDYYKGVLSSAVRQAGHVSTLSGIEFAADIVREMDLRPGASPDQCLGAFLSDMRRLLQGHRELHSP